MLRVLTAIFVVIAILFVGWSLLVMTGGRDWLVASMTEDKAPAKVAANEEAPKEAQAEPAEPKSAESKEDATPALDGQAEDQPAEDSAAAQGSEAGGAEAGDSEAGGAEAETSGGAGTDPGGNPTETAKSAGKGSLTSPYKDSYEEVAEEGHKKFMAAGCNGCHGGTGGGGMGPPLSNPVWIYGNDGDTLFRLIALGTNGLQEQGYSRKGSENVVGPMPPHGQIVKSNDDLWKIIAWIWSINPPDKSASAAQ